MIRIIFFLYVVINFFTLQAKTINIVTTTTDLAWLAKQIGGSLVSSTSLLSSHVDPHFADAVPDYILKVANADMVCFVGLKLEVGWLPKVLEKSGNAKVQSGGTGYCNTGAGVKAINVLQQKVDRSMGDVHADGNPHFQLSPDHLIQAAEVIYSNLLAIDSKNAQIYSQGFEKLKKNITAVKVQVQNYIKSQSKTALVMEYHKEFSYFFHAYGIKSFGAIEEVPGVPPSAGRLAMEGISAKKAKVNVILATEYNPSAVLKKFSNISGINFKIVPISIDLKGKYNDFSKVQMAIVKSIYE